MDIIIRSAVIYFALLVLLRITGNRSLSQITVFDFILLLIISEAAQNGLVGNDYSITNSLLIISTLVAIDIGLSKVKSWLPRMERFIEGTPLLLVRDGAVLRDHLKNAGVDEDDILEAGRKLQGLQRLDEIKYAVLERDGDITIVPQQR